jgi:ectoine hydroxylase-related dioxygenase (phytanoyl-CoA dioxygenase family)
MKPSEADLQEHVGRISREGYTILPDVLDGAFLDAMTADLERIIAEESIVPARNIFEGTKTLRVYNLLARGKIYEQLAEHASVLPLIDRVLDRGCLVSSFSSTSIGPGETAQLIHADDQVIGIGKPHVPIICNTMFALTDFTEENGATRLVPGSHHEDHSPEIGGTFATIPAVMRRGSVLVWNGSLWHGGGANHTEVRRVGVAVNYCAGYIRQQENQQLGIPVEIARGFSPRLRKLVGYGIYRGLIGHIDKCSPVDILDGTGPRRVVGEVG